MKTDVDTALKEIADFFVKNRRTMTAPEFQSILTKHCESKAEMQKFAKFLETEPGQLRFRTHLREMGKEARGVIIGPEKPSYLKEAEIGKLWRRKGQGLYEEVLLEYKGEMLPFLYYDPVPGKAYFGSRKCPVTIDTEHYIRESVYAPFYKGGIKTPAQLDQLCEKFKPSQLQAEECQLISPRHYDLLGWLGASVPDYSFAIEPEAKERKIDEVLDKLKDGVSRIHESAVFREFLTTMSKFHYYSIYNQMLIALQRPAATRVAGFVTWKDLGRHVRFGEKGIAILAPCLPPRILKCPLCEKTFTERELRTHLVEVHHRDDVSILVREAREKAEAPLAATYFKVVNVFDVSQTEGKPLPEIVVPVLSGAFSKELYDKLMALASKQSLTVSFDPKPLQDPEIKGSLLGKDIWVKGDEPEAQRLKTLAHEEAHYFTEHVYFIPRADAEVIAESVAFVVCAHFGFDSGIRSFPYVAIWAKEKKVLEQNLASIRKISGRMIEELGG